MTRNNLVYCVTSSPLTLLPVAAQDELTVNVDLQGFFKEVPFLCVYGGHLIGLVVNAAEVCMVCTLHTIKY